ncbi:MAG: laccase domain-containing protein, partial [Lachnospiraceae bacterium]|nr:laccase domain-containing protein [Lachnospiraceae bacterium]
MEQISMKGLPALVFPELAAFPFVSHLFTTRQGGVSEGEFSSLNLSFTRGDKEEAVIENFRRVANA